MSKGRLTGLNSPYRRMQGHINSQFHRPSEGWVVLYRSAEARIPLLLARGKYAVICEVHGRVTQQFNREIARRFQTHPDLFCQDCRNLVKKTLQKTSQS